MNSTVLKHNYVKCRYSASELFPLELGIPSLLDGYSQDIAIYDYNPAGKSGVSTVFVRKPASGSYETAPTGSRRVWIVTVAAEISSSGNSVRTYFIDKETVNYGSRRSVQAAVKC